MFKRMAEDCQQKEGVKCWVAFLRTEALEKVSLSIVPKHILLEYFLPRRASKVLPLGVPPLGKVWLKCISILGYDRRGMKAEKEPKMTNRILLMVGVFTILIGCASNISYTRSSSNDVPFEKRKPPSGEPSIIVSADGPQLDSKYYDILGKVMSQTENILALEKHCEDAIKLLRFEADKVGADALIHVSCSSGKFNGNASGVAISFKNREEALNVLRQIGARIQ